jgi:hypothetical protein
VGERVPEGTAKIIGSSTHGKNYTHILIMWVRFSAVCYWVRPAEATNRDVMRFISSLWVTLM